MCIRDRLRTAGICHGHAILCVMCVHLADDDADDEDDDADDEDEDESKLIVLSFFT